MGESVVGEWVWGIKERGDVGGEECWGNIDCVGENI